MSNEEQPHKLNLEDGKRALVDHARERGAEIFAKYGPDYTPEVLAQILKDDTCVRFPVELGFDRKHIEPGLFAICEPVNEEKPSDGYSLLLHEHFQNDATAIAPLLFYHLVRINYGEFATHSDAEAFGAAAMGMEEEAYYQRVVELVDGIV